MHLCYLLLYLYGIEAKVLYEKKNYYYIRILKKSVPCLLYLVKPYSYGAERLTSCEYKFKYVNTNIY